MSRLTYEEACIAMQAGVATVIDLATSHNNAEAMKPFNGKHLRVGVNVAMSDHAALAHLLVSKGLITEAELKESMADLMRKEVAAYEVEIARMLGPGYTVSIGYDRSTGRGMVTIETPARVVKTRDMPPG